MDLILDDMMVSLPSGELSRGGARVGKLTGMEAGLLAFLARHAGEDVSRDRLHREVWGYAERVRSRAVDFTMGRLRKKVEPDPADPRFLHTVRGAGYRFDPGRRAPPPPAGPPPNTFVGREPELKRLASLFAADARLVTVLGMGGVGKTRLVLEFLAHADPDALGELAAVDLSAVTTRAGLLDAVSARLGLPSGSGDPVQRIGERLSTRPTLLLLDDVDHVVADAAALVTRWLTRPGVRLLVTARERLRLVGEHLLEVAPLPPADAERLFRVRCEAARGPLPNTDQPAIREIAARLAGWPLALELAAARTRVLSPHRLLDRLDPLALSGRERDRPARHRSVDGVLADTVRQLSSEQTHTLLALALLPHGASLDALERLLPARDPVDAVADLADRALVRVEERWGQPRVHTVGLVGRWIRARAPEDPRFEALVHSRIAWAADHAQARATEIARGAAWRDAYDLERANLRAIWAERGAPTLEGVRLGVGLVVWWTLRGSWSELAGIADAVLCDAQAVGEPSLLAAARLEWINSRRLTGRGGEALPLARKLYRTSPHSAQRRQAGFLLGATLRRRGELDAAEVILADLSQTPDLFAARAATVLALILDARGQSAEAVAAASQALALVEALPAPAHLTAMGVNLAVALRHHGQLDRARRALTQAEQSLPLSGSPRLKASLLHERGQVEIDAGHLAQGERYGLAELETYRSHGDRAGAAWPLGNLGVCAAERGELGLARDRLSQALELHLAVANRTGEAATQANLGILCLLEGDRAQAVTHLSAALELAGAVGLDRYLPLIAAFLQLAQGRWRGRVVQAPPQDLRLLRQVIDGINPTSE